MYKHSLNLRFYRIFSSRLCQSTRTKVMIFLLTHTIAKMLLTCTTLMNQPYSLLKSVVESAPVVQTLDSAVHRINHYPAHKYVETQLRSWRGQEGGGRVGGIQGKSGRGHIRGSNFVD